MGVFANDYDGPSLAEQAQMLQAQAAAMQAHTQARTAYLAQNGVGSPQNSMTMPHFLQAMRDQSGVAQANIRHTDAQTGYLNTQNQWFGPSAASQIAQNYEQANFTREGARGLQQVNNYGDDPITGQPRLLPSATSGLAYGAPGGGRISGGGLNGLGYGWAGGQPAPGPDGSYVDSVGRRYPTTSPAAGPLAARPAAPAAPKPRTFSPETTEVAAGPTPPAPTNLTPGLADVFRPSAGPSISLGGPSRSPMIHPFSPMFKSSGLSPVAGGMTGGMPGAKQQLFDSSGVSRDLNPFSRNNQTPAGGFREW